MIKNSATKRIEIDTNFLKQFCDEPERFAELLSKIAGYIFYTSHIDKWKSTSWSTFDGYKCKAEFNYQFSEKEKESTP